MSACVFMPQKTTVACFLWQIMDSSQMCSLLKININKILLKKKESKLEAGEGNLLINLSCSSFNISDFDDSKHNGEILTRQGNWIFGICIPPYIWHKKNTSQKPKQNMQTVKHGCDDQRWLCCFAAQITCFHWQKPLIFLSSRKSCRRICCLQF